MISVPNVKLETLSAIIAGNCVPIEERLKGIVSAKKITRLKQSIGFEAFSVADENTCTSDFCVVAAEKIFESVNISRQEIGALIFVTQTPDYVLPATSYILQQRLNLPREIATFDVGLGCSGFVYGLYIGASLLQNLPSDKVLLLCGDTDTKNIFHDDVNGLSIFGDAGTAAVISKSNGQQMYFNLQTFGEFADSIIMRRGAYRNPLIVNRNTLNLRENFGEMDGAAVLDFSIKYVPPNITALMSFAGVDASKVEMFYMHQANEMVLKNLAMLLGVPEEKIPFRSARIGNTSSASIPVAMAEMCRRGESVTGLSVLSGFGVGMSIASAVIDLTDLTCLEIGEL